jgi:mRNA interferase MazF
MVSREYVPEAGDIVWLQFDPKAGREQRGHGPALILSPALYNGKSGLALVCPITSRIKGYAFEVPVRAGKVKGAVLTDQLGSVDWREREAKRITRAPAEVTSAVREMLQLLLQI